jgi:hypothetical protein
MLRPMRKEVRSARRQGRQLIGIALAYPILAGLLWAAQPGGIDPMPMAPAPSILGFLPVSLIPVMAFAAAYFTGLAWMIRIYRTSHLEPETSSWRYREV